MNEVFSIITEVKEEMKQFEAKYFHLQDDKHIKLAKKRPKCMDQQDINIPDKIPRGKIFNEEERMDNMAKLFETVKPWLEFKDNQGWNENCNVTKPLLAAKEINDNVEVNRNSSELVWSQIDEKEWYQNIQKELMEDPKCCVNDRIELSS